MKERIQKVFAEQLAAGICSFAVQRADSIATRVYKTSSKTYGLAFHSLFSRILRFDIEKYLTKRTPLESQLFHL